MAIPSTGRFAPLTIQSHFAQAKLDNPTATVTAKLAVSVRGTDRSLRFTAGVSIMVNGVVAGTYDVASASGKAANYADVDRALKMLAAIIPSSTGQYDIAVNVGGLLDKVPPNDLVAAATSQRTAYQNARARVATDIADADAQLALMVGWESGNSLQVAKKAEVTTQRATMVALVATYDSEITRLIGIIG